MNNNTVLITGGAGYIGSHAVLTFRDAGHTVVVLDNLATGFRSAVPDDVLFVEGNASDQELVGKLIAEHSIQGVVHFAGSIVVPESVTNPLKYYRNNTGVSRSLIEACVHNGVKNFIFSSPAAVYGIPDETPILESTPTSPINPYGSSKLMTEWVRRDTAAANDFRYVALRYFNVAGADPEGRTGQSSAEATHLIKIASQVVAGKRDHLDVYGDDYETADGTCVRDYIHVTDLASAHLKAYEYLQTGSASCILNCGYGHGASVLEVVDAVKRVSKMDFPVRIAARRPGDAPTLVADNQQIKDTFDWEPQFDDIDYIVRTAIDWERKLKD